MEIPVRFKQPSQEQATRQKGKRIPLSEGDDTSSQQEQKQGQSQWGNQPSSSQSGGIGSYGVGLPSSQTGSGYGHRGQQQEQQRSFGGTSGLGGWASQQQQQQSSLKGQGRLQTIELKGNLNLGEVGVLNCALKLEGMSYLGNHLARLLTKDTTGEIKRFQSEVTRPNLDALIELQHQAGMLLPFATSLEQRENDFKQALGGLRAPVVSDVEAFTKIGLHAWLLVQTYTHGAVVATNEHLRDVFHQNCERVLAGHLRLKQAMQKCPDFVDIPIVKQMLVPNIQQSSMGGMGLGGTGQQSYGYSGLGGMGGGMMRGTRGGESQAACPTSCPCKFGGPCLKQSGMQGTRGTREECQTACPSNCPGKFGGRCLNKERESFGYRSGGMSGTSGGGDWRSGSGLGSGYGSSYGYGGGSGGASSGSSWFGSGR